MKIPAAATLFVALGASLVDAGNRGEDKNRERVPPKVLERFDRRNQVKPGRELDYQRVGRRRNQVTVGDSEISLWDTDLEPAKVMTPSSRMAINGHFAAYQPMVFKSKQDESVTITKDVNGNLLSASKRARGTGRGKKVDVLKLSYDTFVSVDADDLDDEQLKQFSLESHHEFTDGRSLRSSVEKLKAKKAAAQGEGTHQRRSLNTVDYDVIDLDVVADHHFCNLYGGQTGAVARIESIVAEASTNFEGFGVKLEIGTVMMDCDTVTDPVSGSASGFLNITVQEVCGGSGALAGFRSYVAQESSLTGDLAHLFYGYADIPGSSIGCAYRGNENFMVLCRNDGYNTGVNRMTFSETIMEQANLLSHEIGHNLHKPHEDPLLADNLMNPWLCNACLDFNTASITVFEDTISNAPTGCILPESYVPTPPPTPAPTTAAPTPAPNVVTPSPTLSNCFDATNWFIRVNGGDPQPLCEFVADPGVTWTNTAALCMSYSPYCPFTCGTC